MKHYYFISKKSVLKASGYLFFLIIRPSLFLLPAIFLLISAICLSQTADAGLWTSISAEKKISKSFSLSFNETFRFNENISELGNYFTEIGLEKKIIKGLSLGLSYRFINKRDFSDDYFVRHRYLLDISYRRKIADFSIGFRSRFQSQVEDYFFPSEALYGKKPDHYWRNKFSIRYQELKKIKPSVSAEWWYPLNAKGRAGVDNLRAGAGFQYDLNKKSTFELDYIIQREFQKKNPQTDFIISMGYVFSF